MQRMPKQTSMQRKGLGWTAAVAGTQSVAWRVSARWWQSLCGGPVQMANAQWQLEIEAGTMFNLQDIELERDSLSVQSDLDLGGSFALGAGYSIHEYVDLTGRFQGNFAGVDIGIASDTFYALSLTGGARLYPLPPSRIRPWLGGEVGWYRAEAEVGVFDDNIKLADDSFGINAGGGIDFAVSERLVLGIAARYHNAFDALGGLEFVSTTVRIGIRLGADR